VFGVTDQIPVNLMAINKGYGFWRTYAIGKNKKACFGHVFIYTRINYFHNKIRVVFEC
jgi:hypothetical protein